ncbi:FAD-dependent oxidoreductase [Castellaniella sp. GW247-6E4]|uniref:NAD(P)/FAD-dependent oxidoreductase n=1 Tax=Castellaniella sp. GW247-6E4 TaxID=3140380 RepID=UPI0033149BFA
MDFSSQFVVVGGGLAGAVACKALRDGGFKGQLHLVGDEGVLPYERPPLSKDVLLKEAGSVSCDVLPQTAYKDLSIDTTLGAKVELVDWARKEVVFHSGARLPYEKVLISTGSRPRRLPIFGEGLKNVLYLRDIQDAYAIKAALTRYKNILIVGGGWIGLEVAAAARILGLDVTVLDVSERLCNRINCSDLSAFLRDLHLGKGVHLKLGCSVSSFDGDSAVERVRLSDGSLLAVDLIVVGIGSVPNSEIVADADGNPLSNGLLVDEWGRTDLPDVFAAGDVSVIKTLGGRVRFESWDSARHQAQMAANGMLDDGKENITPYAPWFWSTQYGNMVQMVGDINGDYEVCPIQTRNDEDMFLAFCRDEMIYGAISYKFEPIMARIKRQIKNGKPMSLKSARDLILAQQKRS